MPATVRFRPPPSGGAASRSSLAPWERFLADLPGGGGIAARPEPGSQEDVLARAETAYANKRAQGAALGTDSTGEAAPGLLTRLLGAIDAPKSAVVGGVSGLLGLDVEGDPADENPAVEAARRFWRGLNPADEFTYGVGDLPGLKLDEGDGLAERIGKRGAAFLGDVAADPLTYLTLGGSVVGKKAATEMVEAGVRKAAERLPASKLDEFARRGLPARAADSASELGDEVAEAAVRKPSTFTGTDEEWVRGLGSAVFSGESAEQYLKGGSGGLRRWLDEELGEKVGREVFESLPRDVRGGVKLRVPFARDEQGARKVVALSDGETLERMGLGFLSEGSHSIRNAARSSRLGQAVADRLGGADGKLYGEVVSGLARDPDDLGRTTYAMYAAAREARSGAKAYSRAMHDRTARALGWMEEAVRRTDDPDAARAARDRWFMAPERLRSLTEADVESMAPTERAGVAAARAGHDYLGSQLDELRSLGLSVGEIDEYVPRVLTAEEKAARRAARPAGRGRTKGGGGYDQTKGRQRYATVDVVEDANGQPVTRWRWLTPDEANAASGRPVFETDPVKMIASYGEAAGRVASRVKFANLLNEAGVLARGGTERLASVNPSGVRRLADLIEDTGETLRRSLGDQAADTSADRLGELTDELHRLAGDREALARATAEAVNGPDPLERVGVLVEGALDLHRRAIEGAEGDLARGLEGAAQRLTDARKAYRRALGAAGGAVSGDDGLSPGVRYWQEAGLRQIGDTADAPMLPPELDLAWAPEVLSETVEKFYRASVPGSEDLAKLVDGVYRPYLSLFKTWATVGRGPGYHVRNLVGGAWNNWLADVRPSDYRMQTRLMQARRQAATEVREREAAKLATELGVDVNEAASRLDPSRLGEAAEVRLRELTSDVEVASGRSLYDVHRAMGEHSIGYGSRVTESLHDVLDGDVDVLGWAAGDTRRNLFRGRPADDLNRTQRGVNRAADNWWIRKNATAAQLSEEFLRGAAFVRGVRRYGMDDGGRSASLLTKALQFDYDDLSDFERTWMRGFAVPFYTWTRNNVPLQLRALMHEPGKVHRLVMANEALRDVFGDPDENVVPEWMAERMGWTSRFTFGGSPIVVGVESPVTDLNKWLKIGRPGESLRAGARELTSNLSPVIKTPVELLLGVDTFTGAPLSEDGVEAPDWYRMLPGVPKRTDAQGRTRMPAELAQIIRGTLPPVGQADRVFGLSPSSRERQLTSIIAQTFPVVSTATLTPRQKAGELRSRIGRMDREADWQTDPELVEAAKGLLEQGYTPEQVRTILEQRRR